MKWLLISTMLFMSGCTMKITLVDICPDVGERSYLEMYIDNSGASVNTKTDQAADGKPDIDLNLPLGGS